MTRNGESDNGLPRTTTTGDEAVDFRQAGDGADDRSSDSVHHTEDAVRLADTRGYVAGWKARLRRRRGSGERRT